MEKKRAFSAGKKLVVCCFILFCFGLLAILSSSSLKSQDLHGEISFFLKKQAAVLLLVCLFFLLIQKIPLHLLERLALPFLLFSIFLLLLIFVPGVYSAAGGAKRWIRLGFLSFQPAELTKIAFVFFLAKNISRQSYRPTQLTSIFSHLAVLSLFVVLLLFQPDFGTACILTLLCLILIFLSGTPLKFFFSMALCLILGASFAIISSPYRMKRLLGFLDPWENVRSGGYQIIQSYIAFNNGKLFGTGFGMSKQTLFFLPEAHTDFILSVIAEELGLLGSFTVLLFFFYIIYLGATIVKKQKKGFYKNLALGLVCLFSCQTILNLFVVTGLLPTKGLPLPFVSYGSSSILCFSLAVSLLYKLDKQIEPEQKKPSSI